ncbi:HD domain-containing protein [Nocardia goodfellowii]|uniref:HD/PDEase domain-containing protein n=1 Tax=Nocardia goodfellowii TaxID=882446 RepID=A0ABS4QJC8_9NOCA|nr:HD domain-containing protein [Nocardia goodfellowii]MBP2191823.1 hypothetical protein [Nocardia goodfellowii]
MSHNESGDVGRLDRRAKLGFARRAAAAQLAGLPSVVRAGLGRGGRGGGVELADAPPDSRFTREARDLAEACYSRELEQHALRCWYFGDIFAQLDGRVYDAELLYVACLLHDVGLTERHRPRPDGASCFAVHGAEVARASLLDWGADAVFAETVSQAIALHMDVSVPVERGIEAHLLHAGAHLDVAGVRSGEVPRAALVEVIRAHPRDGFVPLFLDAMRREARERPDSRAAVLWKQGMRLPVSLNPLDRLSTS